MRISERTMQAVHLFNAAQAYIEQDPRLRHEVQWQRSRKLENVSESEFLQEAAWVILCSGFREAVVRKWFSYISLCFCDWESAQSIVNLKNECVVSARHAINHRQKLEAIVDIAEHVCTVGFEAFKGSLVVNAHEELQKFAFIGPITAQHLAKNIGAPIAKADRHLLRLSQELGFQDVDDLCSEVGEHCGEPVAVVDVILWRYIADHGFGSLFSKDFVASVTLLPS